MVLLYTHDDNEIGRNSLYIDSGWMVWIILFFDVCTGNQGTYKYRRKMIEIIILIAKIIIVFYVIIFILNLLMAGDDAQRRREYEASLTDEEREEREDQIYKRIMRG